MGLTIHILCWGENPMQSQLGVSMRTLMGDDPVQIGCGGSETGLLTLCEAWHNRGDTVILYNNPRDGWSSPFEQRDIGAFHSEEARDILIIFRTPNQVVDSVNNCKKVWLSCDQFTQGNYSEFNSHVHKTVCISPRHINYFKETYHIENAIYIDLPVRVQDYENKNIKKIKNRFMWSSVPARGLDQFFQMWSKIKQQIPDASLVVTADYRLWGSWIERSDGDFVARSLSLADIIYLGALPRPKYVEEQFKAEIMDYCAIYDELQCLAVAEAQVAGVYTITSDFGALPTTNMHKVISGDPRNAEIRDLHIQEAVRFLSLSDEEKYCISEEGRQRAIERFCPDNILKQWDSKVFN